MLDASCLKKDISKNQGKENDSRIEPILGWGRSYKNVIPNYRAILKPVKIECEFRI